MDNAYTISAHFGKKMSRDHNIRNRNITNSEDHIDPDGYFRIIEDRPIKKFSDRLCLIIMRNKLGLTDKL